MFLHIYKVIKNEKQLNMCILTNKNKYHFVREFDIYNFEFKEIGEVFINYHAILAVKDVDFGINRGFYQEIYIDISSESIWMVMYDNEIVRSIIKIYEFEESNESYIHSVRYRLFVDI